MADRRISIPSLKSSSKQRAKLLELAQAWIRLADEGALMMPPDSQNLPAPSQRR
jgi:hypothetical protein